MRDPFSSRVFAARLRRRPPLGAFVAILAMAAAVARPQPLGSAFTYQGRLSTSGASASGLFDFEFRLFDDPVAGSLVGGPVSAAAVVVTAGLFTATLDFGSGAFAGQKRWLDVRVRAAGGGAYTTLSPRQELTPAPNAAWAAKAGDAQTLGGVASSGFLLAGSVVSVAQGGTGASDAAGARNSLQAAKSGANADITSLSALATPLSVGQGGTGAATASAALTALGAQARVLGTCPPGQYVRVVNSDGSVVCGVDADTNSGGTVTNLSTGAGLTGGPIATTGTVSIATGGVTSAMIANGAVGVAQINTSQVQARLAATCPGGQYLRGANADGSVVCGTFDFSPTITSVGVAGGPGYASIAIGAEGFPVISYLDAASLMVAKCVNTACTGASTITTVDASASGAGTSIAIGVDGFPVISYVDQAGALKVAKCVNVACTGVSTIAVVDNTVNTAALSTSIAIGADGLPVISYLRSTGFLYYLMVAKCATMACSGGSTLSTVDGALLSAAGTSVAVGASGDPIVAYGGDGFLKIARCANPACGGSSTDYLDFGGGPSITIGADGYPIIGYFGSSAIRVAKCTDATCAAAMTVGGVDAANSAEGSISALIDADGSPVFSYRGGGGGPVKLGRCASANCIGSRTIATVDGPGLFVGVTTSVALGADGLPVVAYCASGALRVAKCSRPNCLP